MTPFSSLIAQMTPADGGFGVVIPDDWTQGRATYGGLSAALCVEAALRAVPDLPPLRSAQFSFVGPTGAAVTMRPKVLRQGKSVTFIAVDLIGEQGLATHAVLAFGARRDSQLSFNDRPAPQVVSPDQASDFFRGERRPVFAQHFEFRSAGAAVPLAGAGRPEYLFWIRHRDSAAGASIPGLVALADAPPPAALALASEFAPISTMTWLVDVVSERPLDGGDWRLMRCYADTVANGYSSQEIAIWSAAGEPIMLARQTIAIFA